jgi:hypothetical protein
LNQLVHIFRKELRYPLKELLDTQNDYFQLCLDETLRGEVNLTEELMNEMAHFRRTFLFLKEIQKYFTLREVLGIDVVRECYTPIAAEGSTAEAQSLPGRRLESFHLIGVLTELCRCFESDMPVPIKVHIKVCPSIPITIQMDKELLITFLVNVMFQSVSNIKTFPQVHLNTSDLVHEILVLVTKRPSSSGPKSGASKRPRMHDIRGFDSFLDITIMDTGLNNVLTACGLLAGEGFQTDSGICWFDGSSNVTCVGIDRALPSFDSNLDLWATVYVQLQEYLFRKAVQRVGGQFKRSSVTKAHSSYRNEVSVSLPMYSSGSTASLRLRVPSPSSASYMMSREYSHYREISFYHQRIYDKMTW